jgi:hypothetical protein
VSRVQSELDSLEERGPVGVAVEQSTEGLADIAVCTFDSAMPFRMVGRADMVLDSENLTEGLDRGCHECTATIRREKPGWTCMADPAVEESSDSRLGRDILGCGERVLVGKAVDRNKDKLVTIHLTERTQEVDKDGLAGLRGSG